MIQLRWYKLAYLESILQYRTLGPDGVTSAGERVCAWSEWRDVPTVAVPPDGEAV